MRHTLLTLSACLAFAAGYAEKPVKGAHLRLENATYNFGDVPRKGGDLGAMTLDAFKEKILEEVKTRARD